MLSVSYKNFFQKKRVQVFLKNVEAQIKNFKNKNVSKALGSGLFLTLAYFFMNKYQGFPYFIVLKNEPKYKPDHSRKLL